MHYVYLLKSERGNHRYIGSTNDLRERLQRHNAGCVPQTAEHRPWILQTYVAFGEKPKASAFERYLKSGSGTAFANRRLW